MRERRRKIRLPIKIAPHAEWDEPAFKDLFNNFL